MYSWKSELSSIEERALFIELMSRAMDGEDVRWELAPTSMMEQIPHVTYSFVSVYVKLLFLIPRKERDGS